MTIYPNTTTYIPPTITTSGTVTGTGFYYPQQQVYPQPGYTVTGVDWETVREPLIVQPLRARLIELAMAAKRREILSGATATVAQPYNIYATASTAISYTTITSTGTNNTLYTFSLK